MHKICANAENSGVYTKLMLILINVQIMCHVCLTFPVNFRNGSPNFIRFDVINITTVDFP